MTDLTMIMIWKISTKVCEIIMNILFEAFPQIFTDCKAAGQCLVIVVLVVVVLLLLAKKLKKVTQTPPIVKIQFLGAYRGT